MQDIINQITPFNSINLNDLNKIVLSRRVDSKFIINTSDITLLLSLINNYYDILEVKGNRILKYSTVYFDTLKYNLYIDHHNNVLDRFKVRIRTYEKSNQSFLEIKKRTNKKTTEKVRIQILKTDTLSAKHYNFIKANTYKYNNNLIKSIENNFNRITLISKNKNERISIDFNINFLMVNKSLYLHNLVVLEIKREDVKLSGVILKALKSVNAQPIRFSKYCIGMSYIYPHLKQNNFKKIRLKIDKYVSDIK